MTRFGPSAVTAISLIALFVAGSALAAPRTPTPASLVLRESDFPAGTQYTSGGIPSNVTRAMKRAGIQARSVYFGATIPFGSGQANGKWRMQTLEAATLTEAKRERASLLAGIREGRIATKDGAIFSEVFEEYIAARNLSDRTKEYEQYLLDRYLATMKGRRVQDVSSSDVARLLRDMRGSYSGWTCSHVHRILRGTFQLALRRGLVTKNPCDGLTSSEKPKQRNARKIERLDSARMEKLISSTATERWKAAVGLAGLAGLRLGEVRGLKWGDISFDDNAINVRRSLLPDGEEKGTKSEAGTRTIALFPALRRLVLTWKIKSPRTEGDDYVISTFDGSSVQQRNLRRILQKSKEAAGMDATEDRLSWHSLRHSAGSIWLTEYGLPVTTVSAMLGHANPSFTLACYGRDPRDEQAIIADALERAAVVEAGS